ncbi:MAG: alpha-2-macroglobulin, partial [Chloroflexota bacterium]|nr:alpha-2-macroglobulin [Chloroflexota bacterium]
ALEFSVPTPTISAAVGYLNDTFQAPKDMADNWRLNEMAFVLFVLAESGQGDVGRASTLYDERERLDHYGRAYLAMALNRIAKANDTTDERVDTLLDNLFANAQLSATGASWHEKGIDYQTMNTDTRTTSIVLAAFVRLEPAQPLLPNVVRWLMSARQAGRWASTQENAWAIIALTDWMAATGELEADYDWSVTLNRVELGSGSVDADNLTERIELRAEVAELLRNEANALRFARSNDSGQLYYTTHLRYYLDVLGIEARDRGIVVDRRFALDGETVSRAAVGDVISVTVTIVAPTDLHYALIEAPIPAGTEPIDPSLANTSSEFGASELTPTEGGARNGWMNWTPTRIDIRDDKVALFATYLPAGTYAYTFQVRATVPGEYRVLPVHGEMMYFPEVWGRSAGALFTVIE